MSAPDAAATAAAATIVRLGGMAAAFDHLVEAVLAQLRAELGVPPRAWADDPAVAGELAVLRRRLALFRPRFEAERAALVAAHVPATRLEAVATALAGDAVQIYFQALRDMRDELGRTNGTLAAAMKEVALFEEPAAAGALVA